LLADKRAGVANFGRERRMLKNGCLKKITEYFIFFDELINFPDFP